MQEVTVLTNQLLIAMPSLRDPNFVRGVTLLCQHGEDGAMGLMVNRLSEYRLGDVLGQMQLASDRPEIMDMPVLMGGPVQPERGFVLHSNVGEWESSFRISDQLCVTTSRDILVAISKGQGPRHMLVALGYASWNPGQLELEIRDNTWLMAPSSDEILFHTPMEARWEAAAALVGVNLIHLASYAGHA